MEARDAGDLGDLLQAQRLAEMAFDIPERFLGRVHRAPRRMQPQIGDDPGAALDRDCCIIVEVDTGSR